jgi:hypothetical protein
VVTWLDEKAAVDRFEAVAGLGLACLLAAWAGRRPLPFILCACAFFAAMSFFELPRER